MQIDLPVEVWKFILEYCDEWGLTVDEFIENDVHRIFSSKYVGMMDNQFNRQLFINDIINYMQNESIQVKREKKLKDLGI